MVKRSPSAGASGAFSEPSSIAPPTRTTAGPVPTRSNAIAVPSFDATRSITGLGLAARLVVQEHHTRVVGPQVHAFEVRIPLTGREQRSAASDERRAELEMVFVDEVREHEVPSEGEAPPQNH